MSIRDSLKASFASDTVVVETSNSSSITVKPGEVLFPTTFELPIEGGSVKIDQGRLFIPSMSLFEVSLRLQKPAEFRADPSAIGWDDPRVMHVLEFQVGINPLGFEFGLIDPDDSEFVSLAEVGDKVAAVYTERPGATAQTPIIHAQWMRVEPSTVTRLAQHLHTLGYVNALAPADGSPAEQASGSTGLQRAEWRASVAVPDHLKSNTAAVMKFQMEHGAKVDSLSLLKGDTNRQGAFVDFLVNHGYKRDLIYSADLPTATEAQKDNRTRFVSSLTGLYFNGGSINPSSSVSDQRSATYLRGDKRGQRYTDNSFGRSWPVRPSCREMTIEGEYFSFVPVQSAPVSINEGPF